MTSKYQPLIDRCNNLYNQQVKIDHPNFKGRLLTGRVVGWALDEDDEDEPTLIVKYDAYSPPGWRNIEDYVRLDQVEVFSLAAVG